MSNQCKQKDFNRLHFADIPRAKDLAFAIHPQGQFRFW